MDLTVSECLSSKPDESLTSFVSDCLLVVVVVVAVVAALVSVVSVVLVISVLCFGGRAKWVAQISMGFLPGFVIVTCVREFNEVSTNQCNDRIISMKV